MKGDTVFLETYKKLTKEQRQAVDTVEGPVVVLAGPGTGKTHILTLRIANILRTTQATPDSIIALTFTESAVRTMRRRLTALIGEETARKITISTFHGFAELVRAEYPDAFSEDIDRRLMGDVEQTLLLREAIDTSDIDILRPVKVPYIYLNDLRGLYDVLLREGLTLEEYRLWGKDSARILSEDESLQYKRGKHIGELTKIGLGKVARFDRVDEAVSILERYKEIKKERGLADFSDMLEGVVEHIASDESLRSDLQERYQYILADEHQDANALQHRLLEMFAYDNHPNLFVVGDEKQSIYRFQGAEIGAFDTFIKKFPRTVVITLTSSFRSYQNILDTAHSVVEKTENSVPLVATRNNDESHVSRIVADDPLDERAKIASLIEGLISDGALPHEIAVITRKNSIADLVAQVLVARGLPVLRAGDLSLTDRPVMRALISLMSYVADPLLIGSLREALLAPWWNIPTTELLRFLRTTSDRDFIKELSRMYPDTYRIISSCVQEALVQTPTACFSYTFTESGARDYFLSHAEHVDDITLVRALMMHLESATRFTEATTFAEAFATLSKAREHGLSPVKVSITEREGFITVITAHKSKGMEFRYVIIPDCTENAWEKGGRASKIPSPFENKQSIDDARRLFYVALTRAKDHAYLSFASTSQEGRDRLPTLLMPDGLPETVVKGEALPLLHEVVTAPAKLRELVEYYLATSRLSPSAVNEYIESPPTFFARRVLRIHEPPMLPLVYGSAIHVALAESLSGASEKDVFATLTRVFERSLLKRDAVFDKLRKEAKRTIEAVLPELNSLGVPVHIEKGFSMTHDVDGVPMTLAGKVDAVFMKDEKKYLADFKTGSSVSAKNEAYARQLALYSVMLSANNESVESGLLLGVSEKGIKNILVQVGNDEKEKAIGELEEVVRELRSGKWHRGAPSDYDALLELLDKRE